MEGQEEDKDKKEEIKSNQARKKVPLKPGHGLMDWLKIVNENKNLSGVSNPGPGRGVTIEELRKHKTKEEGVWTVLKGNVYNITQYLDYHPGGVEELMKGAGKDCTSLFNKKHAWVNFEAFLKNCYIGPFIAPETETTEK